MDSRGVISSPPSRGSGSDDPGRAEVRLAVELPAGCAWFDGHLPGRPVLPGVALLAAVREVVARSAGFGLSTGVCGFGRVRFRGLVAPAERLHLTLWPGREADTVRFVFHSKGTPVCEGLALLADGPEWQPDGAAWRWA